MDGDTELAYCHVSGQSINAAQYNAQKNSAEWIRISAPTAAPRYIPFAWLNLSSYTDTGDLALLPACP
jgi:hypothetical protein